jgi:glycosyltransferase involved in cell wall biosynthesis
MRLSVVVRSKDEADRLRLTLTSLARQSEPAQVIVVNDGSSDHTPAVLAEAARQLPLTAIHHPAARGRAEAANAGARLAEGEVLLFLDGDTLAAPDLVARHAAAHSTAPALIGRGESFHLRCTRFLKDPETGAPQPGEAARLARMSPAERSRLLVTRAQIVDDFAAIERRAQPGIYPGAGPRALYALEMDALRRHPDCEVLWAAASGANLSVRAEAFRSSGGFNPDIDINEHRELALRLCAQGERMAAIEGARSYHMTHRTGWRDPLRDSRWEEVFYAAHPIAAVKLLSVFWAGLSPQSGVPEGARIASLTALADAARGERGIDYDEVRSGLGLPSLAGSAHGAAATRGVEAFGSA